MENTFEKKDIALSLVLGELISWGLIAIIKNIGLQIPFVWLLPIILPLLALAGLYAAYLISRKAPVIYQIAKFALVGFLNTAIGFGVLNLLIWQTGITEGLGIGIINTVAFFTAVVNSYIWNKLWTFKAQGTEKRVVSEFAQFVAVAAIGWLIDTSIVFGITTYVLPFGGVSPELWANVAKVVSTAAALTWNFTGYKLFVFKKKEASAEQQNG